MHFTTGRAIDLNVTYVRSQARADTNAFTTYFDSVLWPIVGQNAYAPARADAPHRMLLRSRVLPTPTWLLVSGHRLADGTAVFDRERHARFRRPAQRLPVSDLLPHRFGIEHRVRFKKFRPWIGIRVDNASEFVAAVRRPGQCLFAGIRDLLQLRVSPGSHPAAIRALGSSPIV